MTKKLLKGLQADGVHGSVVKHYRKAIKGLSDKDGERTKGKKSTKKSTAKNMTTTKGKKDDSKAK